MSSTSPIAIVSKYHDILDIYIPAFLSANPSLNYRVIGARAFDVYFAHKTRSTDWDLIVDQTTCDLFRRYLTGQYMGSLEEKEILMDENTVVNRFALLEFNKIIEDPFFLDLQVKDDVESCKMETFNGIKYLDLQSLSADLLIVHKYRERLFYIVRWDRGVIDKKDSIWWISRE